jgi:hypothetical protein
MASPIERLPVELLDLCTAHLDLPAYQALRLTSHKLYSLTLSVFAKTHFSALTTTLGAPSLDHLLTIASRTYLASAVTLVEITLLNHHDYDIMSKIRRIGIFPPPKRFPTLTCVKLEHIVQESTLYDDMTGSNPRHILQRLTRCLKAFCNLRVVRLRAQQSEPREWRSSTIPEKDQLFRARCFQLVLDALINSCVKLDEFSLAKDKAKDSPSLTRCTNLPFPALQLPAGCVHKLRTCFSSLKALTLSTIAAHNGAPCVPGWANDLGRVIATAPHLERLVVSLDRKRQVSQYGAPVVRSISLSVRLVKLKVLQLHNSTSHAEDLVRLVRVHCLSLRKLTFVHVCLLSGSWHSLINSIYAAEGLRCLMLASVENAYSPVLFHLFYRRKKGHHNVVLDIGRTGCTMASMLDGLYIDCDAERQNLVTDAEESQSSNPT